MRQRQVLGALAGALLLIGLLAGPSVGIAPSGGAAVGSREATPFGVSPRVIGPGEGLKVWGRIPGARRTKVTLQLRSHDLQRWRRVGSGLTDRRGRYAFRLAAPASAGAFELRVRAAKRHHAVGGTRSLTVSTAVPGQTATQDSPVVAGVITLVNAARAEAGCAALAADARLQSAAQLHSEDMAAQGTLSHVGSDGRTMNRRFQDAGYKPFSVAAENVAKGYAKAADVVQGWLDSGIHRANLLDCRLRDAGAGLAHDAGGTTYWTIDLGRP